MHRGILHISLELRHQEARGRCARCAAACHDGPDSGQACGARGRRGRHRHQLLQVCSPRIYDRGAPLSKSIRAVVAAARNAPGTALPDEAAQWFAQQVAWRAAAAAAAGLDTTAVGGEGSSSEGDPPERPRAAMAGAAVDDARYQELRRALRASLAGAAVRGARDQELQRALRESPVVRPPGRSMACC